MHRVRSLLIVFVSAFVIFLLARTPVSLLQPWINSKLPADIQLNAMTGTVWEGQTILSLRKQPTQVYWSSSPISWLDFHPNIKLKLTGSQIKLQSSVWFNPLGGFGVADLSGQIEDSVLGHLNLPRGVQISGRLWIDSLVMQGTISEPVSLMESELRWTGGPVAIPAGRNTLNAKVPELQGQVLTTEQVNFRVTDPDNLEWMQGELDSQGWLSVRIMQQAADAMSLPLTSGRQGILFELKQKVY